MASHFTPSVWKPKTDVSIQVDDSAPQPAHDDDDESEELESLKAKVNQINFSKVRLLVFAWTTISLIEIGLGTGSR